MTLSDENKVKNENWEQIRKRSLSVEQKMNQLERKRTGSYYTSLDLTDVMMKELVEKIQENDSKIWTLTFLEPCVGTGNFVFSYLKQVSNLGLSKEQIMELLNNIYVADINSVALETYEKLLVEFVMLYFKIKLKREYFKRHIGKALLIDSTATEPTYISLSEVFPKTIVKQGFDIVVTNPPYKNLKAERSQYSDEQEYLRDKGKYAVISKLAKKDFILSSTGVLNLYKLFVEEIVCKYSNKDAFISLLVPASILSDKTCEVLRTHILKEMNLLSVRFIAEGSGYIDAQQALTTLLIKKGMPTRQVMVTKDYLTSPKQVTKIDVRDIMNPNTGNAIFSLNKQEYFILKRLRKFPVVKDIDCIINSRGELDLTANKDEIVSTRSLYPLIRGRNIGFYFLNSDKLEEYVREGFVDKSKKKRFVKKPRIICQQVVNMHKKRRVTFSYIDANYVLGNSCNFISVKENTQGLDIYVLLGLFNSAIIDWLFKLTSSNNHINNYEIDCFPVPLGSRYLKEIGKLVRQYLKKRDNALLEKIEDAVNLAYEIGSTNNPTSVEKERGKDYLKSFCNDLGLVIPGVNQSMVKSILDGDISIDALALQKNAYINSLEKKVISAMAEKYFKLSKGEILNHTTFKLSDLDLEMIKAVPQGGSWKDIPKETVLKSKRLLRITQTGGRTTLYGRIDYNKPAYTITTYFNRPGNGTYVHPVHERVISVREAARFQTFPDNYLFCGNKTDMLKEVGNAVPVIMAYNIGKAINDKTGCNISVDLFSGAGGMTYGFKLAGIKAAIANDLEESACVTLKVNSPEIPVVCGDITNQDIKKKIIEAGIQAHADIICGGPPCQGFSMAGFRSENDSRNKLFRDFVDVVSGVNPKIIVFENVEGILSYQGGETYRNIIELFSELGYKTEGRKLMATDYGVPQKRKRVIILCTRKDLNLTSADVFPEIIIKDETKQITAYDTIFDLEQVPCGEKVKYDSNFSSLLIDYLKAKITLPQYMEQLRELNEQPQNENCRNDNFKGKNEDIAGKEISLFDKL